MSDILKIKNRYWQLNGECEPGIAKSRIREGLRMTNATAEKFIAAVNSAVGYDWVGKELFTGLRDDYNLIYSNHTSYMWLITLSTLKVELREKVREPHKRRGSAWNTLFRVAIARS